MYIIISLYYCVVMYTFHKTYDTHFNGDRPFRMKIFYNHVDVYKLEYNKEETDKYLNTLTKEKRSTADLIYDEGEILVRIHDPMRTFIGLDNSKESDLGYIGHCNLILVNCDSSSDNSVKRFGGNSDETVYNYVYVGENLYTFSTSEEITNFVASIGNNDVPYTCGLTKSSIYMFSDRSILSNNFGRFDGVYWHSQLIDYEFEHNWEKLRNEEDNYWKQSFVAEFPYQVLYRNFKFDDGNIKRSSMNVDVIHDGSENYGGGDVSSFLKKNLTS